MTTITSVPAGTPSIHVSELASKLPQSSLSGDTKEAMAHLRSESLKSAEEMTKARGEGRVETLADSRAALRPGPAETQTVSEAEKMVQSLQTLSQMTWRMVTFEVGNASLQKTDKSIKMFIQAQ